MQKMKLSALFTVFISLILGACSSKIIPATDSPDSLTAIIQDFEKRISVPEEENPGYMRNLSDPYLKAEKSKLGKIKKRLANLDKLSLREEELINLDMLNLVVQNRLFELEYESHLIPLNAEGGFLAGIVYSTRGSGVRDSVSFERYKNRLRTLPDYLQMRKDHMTTGQAAGKSSPKIVISNCIRLVEGWLDTPVENSFFINPVKEDPERKMEVINIVKNTVYPSCLSFLDFLKNEYLVKAPEKVGISNSTDGKEYYEQRTKYFTTLNMHPQEVFDTGKKEVTRIRGEMEAIIDQLGFEGSYAEFLNFLRTDPQFYPKSGEELLKQAAWITKEMEGQLPKYFGKLPRMPLTVKPVPAALAPNYTGGRYSPGSYANQKAGEYWVNTYKLESRPYYVLPALSLHEGVPGHHLQIMLAAEMEEMPNFRQRTYISAFGEGWGLYAEYLGKEAGIYKTPYENFGRLTYEMWRACRLVVDPGMHYFGWSRQKALDFMAENTALSIHEVTTEIDRYIGWPGQAVSYKIGELKIRALRAKAEKELGAKFDIRSFHDEILKNGSVPLASLERIIEQYVQRKKEIMP